MTEDQQFFLKQLSILLDGEIIGFVFDSNGYYGLKVKKEGQELAVWFYSDDAGNAPGSFDIQPLQANHRYCYHNQAYLKSGAEHGVFCNPIKRGEKCIVSARSQLVRFEDGAATVVIRRALRLKNIRKQHRGEK